MIHHTVQTSGFHPRLIDVLKRRKAGLYGICFCPLQRWRGSLGWCCCRRRRAWVGGGYTSAGAAGDAASLRGATGGTSTVWGSFMRNHGNQKCAWREWYSRIFENDIWMDTIDPFKKCIAKGVFPFLKTCWLMTLWHGTHWQLWKENERIV